jgi:hypothetical protein
VTRRAPWRARSKATPASGRRWPRPTYNNVVATLCLVAVATGSAVAATSTPSAAKKISACVIKKGTKAGQMRIMAAKKKCKRAERSLSWAQAAVTTAAEPSGMVAYFALATCPAGWAAYTEGQGRYVVGVPQGGTVAKTGGTPLTDGEDRAAGQHTHGVTDPGHSHTAVADPILVGGNVAVRRFQGTEDEQGGQTKQSLTTDPAQTGITVQPFGTVPGTNAPYVQLLACRKA